MKLAILARITVVLLVAVLSLGPAVSFAAPMMSVGQDATSNMAMSDSQVMSAQADCPGCAEADMSKTVMGAHCSIACVSPAMLTTGPVIAEQSAVPQWATAPVEERLGIPPAVDPYPPNIAS